MLTFYSSPLPHYIDYLAPIYLALPAHLRGEFITREKGAERAADYGIDTTPVMRRKGYDLFICAGQQDTARVSPTPAILVNHGIGQTYSGSHASYSGGSGRENVVLHLCPSVRDAERNSVFAEAVAVGPYKLDPWISGKRPRTPDWVVISFHHDANVCPESQSAFGHYVPQLRLLARNWEALHLVGHAHPRARHVEKFWKQHGVPFAQHFGTVLDNAAVYITDNSSTLYEAAAVGIPVVVLDSPAYRTDVHHGGRFWDWADVGVRIQDPVDLPRAIDLARRDPLHIRSKRQTIVQEVYSGLADGNGLQRVVETIVRFCGNSGYAGIGHRA